VKRTFYPALVALVALGSAGSLHAGDREGPAWASAVVAVDGSGQFRSLQAAIAAAPTATSSGSPAPPPSC